MTLKGSHIAAPETKLGTGLGSAPGWQVRIHKTPRQYTPSKLHTLSRGDARKPVRDSRALTKPIEQPSERDTMP